MLKNLLNAQTVFTAILLSVLTWGALSITSLQAVTAVNTDRSNKLNVIIPKMGKSLSSIEANIGVMTNDIRHVQEDIVEIKLSQKDYQKEFNEKLDTLR